MEADVKIERRVNVSERDIQICRATAELFKLVTAGSRQAEVLQRRYDAAVARLGYDPIS